MALVGDAAAQSCGPKVQAQDDCEALACGTCPVRFHADFVAYDTCRMQAAFGFSCGQLVTDCADHSPSAAPCLPQSWATQREWYRYLGELFCGAPGDG